MLYDIIVIAEIMCEIPENGQMTLTEPATIRSVVHEAESSGLVDLKLWKHTVARPAGAANAPGDVDRFDIQPTYDSAESGEVAGPWCLKPKDIPLASVKVGNMANILPTSLINASPRIQPIWVLNVDQALSMMVPKRPEFWLKSGPDLVLAKGQVCRIV